VVLFLLLLDWPMTEMNMTLRRIQMMLRLRLRMMKSEIQDSCEGRNCEGSLGMMQTGMEYHLLKCNLTLVDSTELLHSS
jgi:hypothetical protein